MWLCIHRHAYTCVEERLLVVATLLSGSRLGDVHVEPRQSVADLTKAFSALTGTPSKYIRLVLDGRQLHPQRTLLEERVLLGILLGVSSQGNDDVILKRPAPMCTMCRQQHLRYLPCRGSEAFMISGLGHLDHPVM